MLEVLYHKQFKKDYKNCVKEGKNIKKLKVVITKLLNQEKLEFKYKLHKLVGNYRGRFECHVESDWLLIFKLTKTEIIFERTGSHSKLFK